MLIALIGIGKIAIDQHVPAINQSDDWELAATVSRRETIDGVESFTNLDAMLDSRPDIPTVSICLPPVPRFDYAMRALKAGRHVMLEKPPGATISECIALESFAREQGVSLFATWHSREAEKVSIAKAWLLDKTLKKLTVTWKEDVRHWHPGQDWVFKAGGMGVFDPGVNALSIVTEILPDAIHLRDATLFFPENRETPIAASCDFYHPSGAEVLLELDWLEQGDPVWTIEIETEEATLLLEEGGSKLTIDGHVDEGMPTLEGEYPKLYKRMTELVNTKKIDMDLTPMIHVADAFTLGKRVIVAPFEWAS